MCGSIIASQVDGFIASLVGGSIIASQVDGFIASLVGALLLLVRWMDLLLPGYVVKLRPDPGMS